MFSLFRRQTIALFFAVSVGLMACAGADEEFRGVWVNSWAKGFKSPEQTAKLVEDARAANFNALIVQVRKRGDAYYNGSPHEPKADDINPPEYDPLGDLLLKARETDALPKLEIHAWLNVYPLTSVLKLPGEPSIVRAELTPEHPYNHHKDWLTQSVKGATYDGYSYDLDPGHPEAQRHLYNVAMDIVTRYPVDGLHLDHLRYGNPDWGYNPVSVERFNRLNNRSGKPLPRDPQWMKFRREQVTALLRKIYLGAIAVNPGIKISAGTIAQRPTPNASTKEEWFRSTAYSQRLQDWRGWMEEGILDINIPMVYYKQHVPAFSQAFDQWAKFAIENRFDRHAVVGTAGFLNGISNSITQLRFVREKTVSGARADGVCFYSYSKQTSEPVPPKAVTFAFTTNSAYDTTPEPIFAKAVKTPEMPWKISPKSGHLRGFIYGTSKTNELDGARLELQGPVSRTLISDGTGFFGSVELPPGEYRVLAGYVGHAFKTNTVTVSVGKVTSREIILEEAKLPKQ